MNILRLLVLVVLTSLFNIGCSESTIELPLTYKEGYGPFSTMLSGLRAKPQQETELKVKGIPEGWKNAKVGEIELNIEKTPIAFVYEEDASGSFRMIVDANNNLDFSDDKIFVPMLYHFPPPSDSIIKKHQIMITYDNFLDNEVIKVNTPILITYLERANMLMYNFPGYAVTKFKGEEYAICSNGFANNDYDDISIVMLNDSLKQGKKANQEDYLEEYIKIDQNIYKNKGVDLKKNILVLEKMNIPEDQIYSTQVGFKAPLFAAENFITKDSLALEEFRGKYLYIHFWSLTCPWCIEKFPHYKELYDKIDRSQFEFLGIVSKRRSEESAIKDMIEKHSITWPHVLSDEGTNLTELYGVESFPTMILLDKEGRVVAKGLHGKALEEKINELSNTNR